MAYACHKCGSTIEDGTAFCPHCGAPQIRVSVPEGDSPAFVPGTPAEMQPPAQPIPLSTDAFPAAPGRINWRAAFPGASIAGLLIGIGAIFPLGVAWMVLVVGFGAAMSVLLYKRRTFSAAQMRAGDGAKLGAVASLVGYLLLAIIIVASFVLNGPQVRQELMSRLQAMQSTNPQAQEVYQQLLHKLSTPEGLAVLITAGMAFLFFFFLAVGAAGGALTATLSHRERPRH